MLQAINAEYKAILNNLRLNTHSLPLDPNKLKPESQGDFALLGLDEVGYGCLAGDLWVAATNLWGLTYHNAEQNHLRQTALEAIIADITDSKQISPKKRAKIAEILRENCHYTLGQASVKEIDALNVLQANKLAMQRAIEAWLENYTIAINAGHIKPLQGVILLVDGVHAPLSEATSTSCMERSLPLLAQWLPRITSLCIVNGDAQIKTIAAASIIAKTARDDYMENLTAELQISDDPDPYLWGKNKGYATREHREAIAKFGLSPWHRTSFCRKLI